MVAIDVAHPDVESNVHAKFHYRQLSSFCGMRVEAKK